ncbi:MAG TPA: dephospho-CoA kinase [Pseudonocardia sp.]|jgi:dephospho-CoA kinase
MLRIGLTGGIGAGKSTVARGLTDLGAIVVDADQVAREVVRPGSPGLAEVARAFGEEVLDADGALDRPRLASVVFADPQARSRLNGILHPLIGRRTAELVAEAPADGILVHDVPLIVENDMAAGFALVVVVFATERERIRRLVGDRGMTADEARSRIASQADDDARRAVADVALDNSGSADEVTERVRRLWRERLVPFEENLRLGRVAVGDPATVADPGWAGQFGRVATRVGRAAGERAVRVEHVGPTAVPGSAAADVLEVRLGVRTVADVEAVAPALREVGFVPDDRAADDRAADRAGDRARDGGERRYAAADPGRPVVVYAQPAP